MKLRQVIVVAPIRSKIAPKSGRDNPSRSSSAMTHVLNSILNGPNSGKKKKILVGLKWIQYQLLGGILNNSSKN